MEWVKVETSYPIPGKVVLAYMEPDNELMGDGPEDPGIYIGSWNGSRWELEGWGEVQKISHWSALPKAPE